VGIPAASKLTFEISVLGTSTAGGGEAKNIANVFHYRRTGVSVDASKASLVAIFRTDVLATLVLALNNRASLTQILCRCVDDAEDANESTTIAETGAVAGDGLANYNCVTIRLKTAVRSRSAMGSKHFGPASEADGNNDVLTGTGLTRWQAVRDVLDDTLTDADGNVWKPCVLSRKNSVLTSNPTTVSRNDITSCILNKTYGTLRRRKVKSVV